MLIAEYDYGKAFGTYHSCAQAVDFFMQLYESDKPLGIVNRETFEFSLSDYRFPMSKNRKLCKGARDCF